MSSVPCPEPAALGQTAPGVWAGELSLAAARLHEHSMAQHDTAWQNASGTFWDLIIQPKERHICHLVVPHHLHTLGHKKRQQRTRWGQAPAAVGTACCAQRPWPRLPACGVRGSAGARAPAEHAVAASAGLQRAQGLPRPRGKPTCMRSNWGVACRDRVAEPAEPVLLPPLLAMLRLPVLHGST